MCRYNSNDGDNFGQCTLFWKKTLNEEERSRLIENIVGSLKHAADFIQVSDINICSEGLTNSNKYLLNETKLHTFYLGLIYNFTCTFFLYT